MNRTLWRWRECCMSSTRYQNRRSPWPRASSSAAASACLPAAISSSPPMTRRSRSARCGWGCFRRSSRPFSSARIGLRQLRRYALTAERFSAAEAQRLGLVHRVTPRFEVSLAQAAIVAELLRGAPDAQADVEDLLCGMRRPRRRGRTPARSGASSCRKKIERRGAGRSFRLSRKTSAELDRGRLR